MSAARKHGRIHVERCDMLRELAADLFALSERMTVPARSHQEVDSWIATGEEIANKVRAVFR